MGSAAKKARRHDRQLRKEHGAEVAVAELAQTLWDEAWGDVIDEYCGFLAATKAELLHREPREVLLDLDYATGARSWIMANTTVPSYCWAPAMLVALKVLLDLDMPTEHGNRLADDTLSAAQYFVTLAAWRHAPLIARFDPDIAAALIDTPIDRLPAEALRHLPAPAIFIPTPWLHDDAGAFVTLDCNPLTVGHEYDHLIVLLCQRGGDGWFFPISLDVDTLADAFPPDRVDGHKGPFRVAQPAAVDDMLAERYGRTAVQLCSEIVSVLLYLTSEEPDLTRTRLDRTITPRSTATTRTAPVDIADVGFRLGAALRNTPSPTPVHHHADDNATTSRRGVTAHPRRAHWHTYWTGPRNSDQRKLVLRWIHMIIVGADTTPITIRDVKP